MHFYQHEEIFFLFCTGEKKITKTSTNKFFFTEFLVFIC